MIPFQLKYPYFSLVLYRKQYTVAHRQCYHINVVDILRLTSYQPDDSQGGSSAGALGLQKGPHWGELAALSCRPARRPGPARAAPGQPEGASWAQGRNTTSCHSPVRELHRQSSQRERKKSPPSQSGKIN